MKEPARGYGFPTKRTPIMGFHPSIFGRNTGASLTLPASVPQVTPQKKHRHTDLPCLNVFPPKGQAPREKEGSRPGQPREEPPGPQGREVLFLIGITSVVTVRSWQRGEAARTAQGSGGERAPGLGRRAAACGRAPLPAWTSSRSSQRPRACSAPAPVCVWLRAPAIGQFSASLPHVTHWNTTCWNSRCSTLLTSLNFGRCSHGPQRVGGDVSSHPRALVPVGRSIRGSRGGAEGGLARGWGCLGRPAGEEEGLRRGAPATAPTSSLQGPSTQQAPIQPAPWSQVPGAASASPRRALPALVRATTARGCVLPP